MNESVITKVKRALKRINWEKGSRSPQELQKQIRDLSDESLMVWAKDKSIIGTGEKMLQNKLLSQEIKRRGLNEEVAANSVSGGGIDMNTNGNYDNNTMHKRNQGIKSLKKWLEDCDKAKKKASK